MNCPQCQKMVKRSYLKTHLRSHSETSATSCPKCHRKLKNLKQHLAICKAIEPPKMDPITTTLEKLRAKRALRKRSELLIHQNEDSGFGPGSPQTAAPNDFPKMTSEKTLSKEEKLTSAVQQWSPITMLEAYTNNGAIAAMRTNSVDGSTHNATMDTPLLNASNELPASNDEEHLERTMWSDGSVEYGDVEWLENMDEEADIGNFEKAAPVSENVTMAASTVTKPASTATKPASTATKPASTTKAVVTSIALTQVKTVMTTSAASITNPSISAISNSAVATTTKSLADDPVANAVQNVEKATANMSPNEKNDLLLRLCTKTLVNVVSNSEMIQKTYRDVQRLRLVAGEQQPGFQFDLEEIQSIFPITSDVQLDELDARLVSDPNVGKRLSSYVAKTMTGKPNADGLGIILKEWIDPEYILKTQATSNVQHNGRVLSETHLARKVFQREYSKL